MDDGDLDTGSNAPGDDPLRGRFERAISLAAPFFDLILAVGDRISRVAEPVDYEYYPVRDGEPSDEEARTAKGGNDSSR